MDNIQATMPTHKSVPTSTIGVILVMLLVVGLLGYNYFAKPLKDWNPPWMQKQVQPTQTPEPVAENELTTLINSLTTKQKLAQLLAIPLVVGSDFSSDKSLVVGGVSTQKLQTVLHNDTGWITLFGQNISSTDAAEVTASISAHLTAVGMPSAVAVDHEGGMVQRLSGPGFTRLPSWQEVCDMPDAQRRALLKQSAAELYDVGVNLVLAPMADFGKENRVLKNRICSDNPDIVVDRVSEFRSAFDNQGLGAVVKHFPGIGTTQRDLHTSFDQVNVSSEAANVYRRLLLDENQPIESAPQADPVFAPVALLAPSPAVMVTHVGVTNQYASIPCSLSADCVGELRALAPNALLVTDALEMKSAAYDPTNLTKDLPSIAEQAILAGNDVLLFGPSISQANIDAILVYLEVRYESNPGMRARIDASLARSLAYRQWLMANSKQANTP
jgi:beta-glucosidase-like glycosyl hydrolase